MQIVESESAAVKPLRQSEKNLGDYGKTLHVRLTADQEKKFERVHAEFKGLPSSVVLRMLIADQLNKSVEEQTRIIHAQIRGASESPDRQNRLPSVNRTRSHGG